ncbi:hypothetical protein LPJ66_004143 [Kickxella alabastrina]|uniref:Uncharacterized protein n=1 Tax=Kickxella alabastrina TaxID=61397 RepID=A0ACC1IIC3_9FUNG|nr:hypothetical protein LPJ66_004143 [Kickxella alabastrina]
MYTYIRALLCLALATMSLHLTSGLSIPHLEKRIINGFNMTDPLSPETVAVYRYIDTGKSNCGGTLISNNYAVTAAHCLILQTDELYPAKNISIGYNNKDRRLQTEATALDVIIHPEYFASKRNAKFDIAVVKINPIEFNKNTKRMPIYDGPVYEGQNLLTMGWGTMEDGAKDPDMMRGVLVIAGNSTMCQRFVPEFKDNNGPQICTLHANTPYQTTCQGDSGTGLAIAVGGKMMFAGLTSTTYNIDEFPCGNPTGAEFFVRISYQLDFIMKNTGLSKEYLLGEVE